MDRILVAVDGSDAAARAAHLATELASRSGASLVFVHVTAPPTFAEEATWSPPDRWHEFDYQRGEELLAAAADAARADGLEVSARHLTGTVAESIVEEAERANVDFVAVGSHGRSALGRLLVGSVADKVVHLCKKPVLVVR